MIKKCISVTSHALYPHPPCHKLSHLLRPLPPRAWRTLWTAPYFRRNSILLLYFVPIRGGIFRHSGATRSFIPYSAIGYTKRLILLRGAKMKWSTVELWNQAPWYIAMNRLIQMPCILQFLCQLNRVLCRYGNVDHKTTSHRNEGYSELVHCEASVL